MQIAFALPHGADAGGPGFAYADGMARALRAMGHDATVGAGDVLGLQQGAVPVIDGWLLPSLLAQVEWLAEHGAVALIHHAYASAGRDAESRAAVGAALRAMLPRLRVVATSQPVADRLMAEFALPNVVVVAPGADDLPRSMPGAPCRVLSVGVLTPRKGHDVLLRTMAGLADVDWSLVIAGGAARDRVHASQLVALIEELGLSQRVQLLMDPDIAALDGVWAQAHLFALATRWEGYAAGVAEALRRGVPVITTNAGGALVPPDAGAICSLDDVPTLGKCLRRVMFDADLRADMAAAAWQAGQALPGWTAQATLLAAALEG